MQIVHGKLEPYLFAPSNQMRQLAARFAVFACCAAACSVTHVKAQSMMDQMIFSKCSAAMQADFDKAGKTPAPGLISKTCNCVVKQVDLTHNVEAAKTICTSQLTGS